MIKRPTSKRKLPRRANQPFRAPPAKAAPVLRVKLADLVDDPDLAVVPTMRGLIGEVESLLKSKGKTDSEGKADLEKRLVELRERWSGMLKSVGADGVKEPVYVFKRNDGKYHLRDGRNRADAARLCKYTDVPAVLTDEPALAISLRTTASRRGVSRGCIAFMALQTFPHLLGNKTGPKNNSPTQWANSAETLTVPEVAERIGVSKALLDQAIELGKLFNIHPKEAKRDTPKIFAGVGLGALIAGIKGGNADGGDGGTRKTPEERLNKGLKTWVAQSHKYWEKIEALPPAQAATEKHKFLLELAGMHDGMFELMEVLVKNRDQLLDESAAAMLKKGDAKP